MNIMRYYIDESMTCPNRAVYVYSIEKLVG